MSDAAPRGGGRGAMAGKIPTIMVKAALIVVGYFMAVAAATAVTVVLMLAPTALPDNGARGSFFATMAELVPPILAAGFFYTFICALPGFLVAMVLGERLRWRGWKIYAVAGFFNVMPSLVMFGGIAGSPLKMPAMMIAAFPGGLAGGSAYWAAAGRFVAVRRRPA